MQQQRGNMLISEYQNIYINSNLKYTLTCENCNNNSIITGQSIKIKLKIGKHICKSCVTSENNQKKKKNKQCAFCNKLVKSCNTYCSISCQHKYDNSIKIQNWLDGNKVYNEVTSVIRNYLLEKCNGSCSICGWNKRHKSDNRYLCQIDHIDGVSVNNKPENLRVLCPCCHSETDTYGNRNKNSTRNYRYKK